MEKETDRIEVQETQGTEDTGTVQPVEEDDEVIEQESFEPMFDVDAPKPKMLQIICGILAGAGISASLFLPLILHAENALLNYLFVIIFLVVILIERAIQRKYNVRLIHFTKAWLISLIAGIVIFVIIGIATGTMNF